MEYNLLEPWESLDDWQTQVIEAEGNVVLRSGRQAGKSTAISIKAGDFALSHPKKQVLVIAAVERQAYLLFDKILNYIYAKDKNQVKRGKDRPTKSQIKLKNGAIIRCLPTGLTGYGIRGFTIDLLIADEAAFIPEEVWAAVTPMLAITKGKIILLSTPFGRQGYFYRCFNDPTFEKFKVSTERCPRRDDTFLAQEKKRMTVLQYAQEYLGEFIDELMQLFPDDLIRARQKETVVFSTSLHDKFLGVDVARMGSDESTYEALVMRGEILHHIVNDVTTKTKITDSIRHILHLDAHHDFKKIYIDDAGLGSGCFDYLLEHEQTKRKVVAINNASRPLDRDEKRRKKILKEDLYANLLRLMERGEINLMKDDNVFLSLKSVQYDNTEGKMKIFGNYTHIAEGLIRAAWCVKDKSLNIWAIVM